MGGKSEGQAPKYSTPEGYQYLQDHPDVATGWDGTARSHYDMYGQAEGYTWGAPQVDPMQAFMEMFAAPVGGGGNHKPSASPEDRARIAQEEATKVTGQNDLSALYGEYVKASGAATDYVNQQISDERSNAAVLGVDYNMTDQAKTTRITDYLGTLFSDYEKLQQLEKDFGDKDKPLDFILKPTGGTGGSATTSASTKKKPKSSTTALTSTPEEDTLGTTSILGG